MAAVDIQALNGWYKTRYGEVQKLVPEWAVLQDLIPFDSSRFMVGKDFREPMFLRRSQGVTFNGGTALGTMYTLNAAIPLHSEEIVVTPAEITMREQLAYGAIAQAQNRGPAAFGSAMDEVILGLEESHRFYIESNMLYGNTSIGTIGVVTADTATTKILTISSASWSPGIWAQGEKMLMDVYDTPGGTKINTNAPLEYTTAYDPDAKKILVTGNATDVGNLVAGQVLVFIGTSGTTATTFYGLDAIISNQGTMFGIAGGTYGLWKGNTLALPSVPLTMSSLHSAATRVVVRGGYGKLTFLLSPYAWQDLCDDQSALRRHSDENRKEYVSGATELTFYGSNGGAMVLKPHPMVKAGEAYGIMEEHWVRSGGSDLTNTLPGQVGDDFFFNVPDKNGCEIRNYSNQFVFTRRPAKNVKLTGIVSRSAP